jgi:hypothetical protein
MLAALLPVLTGVLGKAAERLIPDPEARAKWVSDTLGLFMQADLSQLEVNKAEAQNPNLFVSGWRPFIGWVCGAALLYTYLLVPLVVWIGFMVGKPVPKPPTLDDSLWELMFGMLGMGALRSFDKFKGAAK